jgi:hypothetical protein
MSQAQMTDPVDILAEPLRLMEAPPWHVIVIEDAVPIDFSAEMGWAPPEEQDAVSPAGDR